MRRRPLIAALPALAFARAGWALPPRRMEFPRDHGAHPQLRTEWWYITGQAESGGRLFGFQVTFFRSRVDAAQALQSRFAARQLLFAHAAVTDVQGGRLWHDDRIAREGFGIAAAAEDDARLRLRDWSLAREGGAWHAVIPGADFALDLRCAETQPVLLQGQAGLSRKGPLPEEASYYYSEPQLKTQGRLTLKGQAFDIAGTAWLDHEWSEALMHPEAVGWDWIGMNLDDGSALTAFHLRRSDGSALWAGGSFRPRDGTARIFRNDEVRFEGLKTWNSPRTQAKYPTRWRVQTPAGSFEVRALLDDQELDSRGSTGGVYWEGVSDLLDAQGRRVGRGYLEMTGYASPLKL